jgi:RimJ/RimL family protein N-acetyltransferase
MIEFRSIYKVKEAPKVLYALLKEREPEINISHKAMPTWEEHLAFIDSHPYAVWNLIRAEGEWVGSIYLTKAREIGIFIFKDRQGNGYGKEAVQLLKAKYPGRMLANIAPGNIKSQSVFEMLGAKRIQVTYEF